MALLSDYTAGTITVAANGTAVTGSGTAWQAAGFKEGDLLIANGYFGSVGSVQSNTALTLAQPWRGGALAASAYRLRYQGDGSRYAAQARQLIELLGGNGNLEALGGLQGIADRLPWFTGAGQMDVTPFSAHARSMAGLVGGAGKFVASTGTSTAALRDIVGTVAQSSGNPTGALIERGSNANGDYAKFADGTQICWSTGLSINPGSGSVISWTLPAAGLGGGLNLAAINYGDLASADRSAIVYSWTANRFVLFKSSAWVGTSVSVFAVFIGRWF